MNRAQLQKKLDPLIILCFVGAIIALGIIIVIWVENSIGTFGNPYTPLPVVLTTAVALSYIWFLGFIPSLIRNHVERLNREQRNMEKEVRVECERATKALCDAAWKGDMAEITRLANEFPESVNAQDTNGCFPLYEALRMCNLEIADFLLVKGADPNAKDKEFRSAMHYLGTSWHDLDSKTSIYLSIFLPGGGHESLRPHNLERGDPQKFIEFQAMLDEMWLSFQRLPQIAALLMSNGAQIHATDIHGDTPLHLAAEFPAQGSWSEYYLRKAAKCGEDVAQPISNFLRLLIAKGANPNAKNKQGKIPQSDNKQINALLNDYRESKKKSTESSQREEKPKDPPPFNERPATENEKERNYGRILGLKGPVTPDEIKEAYKNMIKLYHPDKTQHLGKELQDLAAHKSREINNAFDYFRNKYGI